MLAGGECERRSAKVETMEAKTAKWVVTAYSIFFLVLAALYAVAGVLQLGGYHFGLVFIVPVIICILFARALQKRYAFMPREIAWVSGVLFVLAACVLFLPYSLVVYIGSFWTIADMPLSVIFGLRPEHAFSITLWISFIVSALSTYLFGFNKDVKALFQKPAEPAKVS